MKTLGTSEACGDEFHMTRCTAGAVSFGKSSLCFFARLPVLVVAMIPWIIPDLRMKRVFEMARKR